MEHPASSRRVAAVHWTVAFTWVRARCYFRCGRQDSTTLWSTRRKRRVATVHRTVAFTWVRACRLYQNKKGARRLLFYFGAGDRTRTCTAKPEEPKSTESTNSTTPACCLQPGYFIMGTGECQWTAAGTLEISSKSRSLSEQVLESFRIVW